MPGAVDAPPGLGRRIATGGLKNEKVYTLSQEENAMGMGVAGEIAVPTSALHQGVGHEDRWSCSSILAL